MNYVLSYNAYVKLILHSIKFPSSHVIGVLIGKQEGSKIFISDSIPLFHNYPLAPMLEASFMQVDILCEEKGEQIVGLYQGNEDLEANSLSETAKVIADKIQSTFKPAVAFLIEDHQIKSKDMALRVFSNEKSSWTNNTNGNISFDGKSNLEKLTSLIDNNHQVKLFDWEEHLFDPKHDWTNKQINQSN
eukprot:TRINITY_DN8071_c0_g1_i1.p1 TRINITY_DN8071_c0_g1~~TRINITY_DN8071_c0_g1_i1.p1  ORF type:complete len:189 (+),score=19.17 TRINITY_DN8071_c0_g1_i1:47-613(+)